MADTSIATYEMPERDMARFNRVVTHVKKWCGEHQWEVGVAEMAAGAALIAAGLQSGALQMGKDVVVSALSEELTARFFGGVTGTALGTLPALALGSIGVAAVGSAIAVPALFLAGGGAVIMGLAGYGAGHIIEQFLHPIPSLGELATSASLTVLGAALLIDGARRIVKDSDVKALAANFHNGVLYLGTAAYKASFDSMKSLQDYLAAQFKPFLEDLAANPRTTATTAALVAAGLLGGKAVAVGSVTVLGSSSLGGLGLSLGLISAPLWPVVAGGGLALAVAYGVWRVAKGANSADRPALPQRRLGP